MNKVVLDASIYVKLFKKEADSEQAIQLLNKLVREGISIVEPSIVVNETITTCEVNKQDITQPSNLFLVLLDSNMKLIEIDNQLIQKTLEITQQGHEKSGFPSFNDSMYHASVHDNFY